MNKILTLNGTTPTTFNYDGAEDTLFIKDTGTYTIDTFGAQGGNTIVLAPDRTVASRGVGGVGGELSADFQLTAGTALNIRIAGSGSDAGFGGGGGGGATSVSSTDLGFLIGAGGGGGGGGDGVFFSFGIGLFGTAAGVGGVGGFGGFGGFGGSNGFGGDGGSSGGGNGGNGGNGSGGFGNGFRDGVGGNSSAGFGGVGGFNSIGSNPISRNAVNPGNGKVIITYKPSKTDKGVDLVLTSVNSPASIALGDNLTYAFNIFNNSDTTATEVKLTETLPSGINLVSSSIPLADKSNNILTFDIGTLAAKATKTVSVVLNPTQVGKFNSLINVGSKETDIVPDNNLIQPTIDVKDDLSISLTTNTSLTGTESLSDTASNLVYTLNIDKSTPSTTATGVIAELILPKGVQFLSSSFQPDAGSEIPDKNTGETKLEFSNLGNIVAGKLLSIPINTKVTGFSQPIDQVENYVWNIKADVKLSREISGSVVKDATDSIVTKVDSLKGFAETQKNEASKFLLDSANEQVNTTAEKLRNSINNTFSDNLSKTFSLYVSLPPILTSVDPIDLSTFNKGAQKTIRSYKEKESAYLKTIPDIIFNQAKNDFVNHMVKYAKEGLTLAGFKKLSLDLPEGVSYKDNILGYTIDSSDGSTHFNIGIPLDSTNPFTKSSLEEVFQGNLDPLIKEAGDYFQKNNTLKVSATAINGNNSLNANLELDKNKNLGISVDSIYNTDIGKFEFKGGLKLGDQLPFGIATFTKTFP